MPIRDGAGSFKCDSEVPVLTVMCLGYLIWTAAYNVFLHPLRSYPGPTLWAMSRIPYTRGFLSGDMHHRILELHKTYGPVVRVAPDFLSYSHPDALKEIRGHRKGGRVEHPKDPVHVGANVDSVFGADRDNHTRMRRAMAHGFSAQAIAEQQPIIQKYVDLMIRRLHEECAGGTRSVDVVKWFNFATFDIIGDLAFGEPFSCLEGSTYHPWVAMIFSSVKDLAWSINLNRYPAIAPLLKRLLVPKEVMSKFAQHRALSEERVRNRLAIDTDRPDFLDAMTKRRGDAKELTFQELVGNASLLITAGSETTATALSAATYYLGMNPRALARLTAEVRSTFAREDEIDLLSVQNLTYMLAVLDEALRMYPPAPGGQPRKIHKDGDVILGRFVPGGTVVENWQWPMCHNPAWFTRPDDFVPERWLGDPRFAGDTKEARQPFSYGPRNCIGKNLAYAEMRLILARVVWAFDIKLAEDAKGWDERSKMYLLWEKGPVNVFLTPRESESV
ncbi:cytochrome P450 [Chaetomium strumarium]|uniref:Cytochrome P450 n=1 Tax=Chaetomium strumarium TaxID=1170767 RepID=A0AAJ0GU94_9PEZI|nr:cytochrome P450 [Chaetomium strumarium]